MKKLLFSSKHIALDFGLLLLRVGFGLSLLLLHGLPKIMQFAEKANSFPDPLGIGSKFSLLLVIFAEVFCAMLLTLGLANRFALLPLVINFAVIVFMINKNGAWATKELAVLYLIAFTTLFFTGPGKFSVDANMR
ncbi:DoxX family protein [Solitalea koreensis]|uniref:Putative oxidoreductase n=1 Tax=Solitalea koreensis TaxID=543615 RepID=A0A521BH75_9SPHI|nr:DoxX family membrane protein [Solitalea koreensis]SMO46281.1 putative oxidoreductase [Solitalea koreensis]